MRASDMLWLWGSLALLAMSAREGEPIFTVFQIFGSLIFFSIFGMKAADFFRARGRLVGDTAMWNTRRGESKTRLGGRTLFCFAAILLAGNAEAGLIWQFEFGNDVYSGTPDPMATPTVGFWRDIGQSTSIPPDMVWNVPPIMPYPQSAPPEPRPTYFVDATNAAAQGFDWQALVDYLASTQVTKIEACWGVCRDHRYTVQGPVIPGRLEFILLNYRIEHRSGDPPDGGPFDYYVHYVNAVGRLFDNASGPYPPYHRNYPEPSSWLMLLIGLAMVMGHCTRLRIA